MPVSTFEHAEIRATNCWLLFTERVVGRFRRAYETESTAATQGLM